MRIGVTVKGEMEEYILSETEKTGLSQAMVLYNLAMQGMEYKKALSTMSVMAAALQDTSRRGTIKEDPGSRDCDNCKFNDDCSEIERENCRGDYFET